MSQAFDNKMLVKWIEDKEVFIKRGHGLSFYNALNPEDIVEFITQSITKEYHIIKTSEWTKDKLSSIKDSLPIIVIQDLKEEALKSRIIELSDSLIFPAWFDKKSIFFISVLAKKAYKVGKIDSRLVHKNLNKISQLLSLEQSSTLLEKVNLEFTLTEYDSFTEINNKSTLVQRDKTKEVLSSLIPLEDLNHEQAQAVLHMDGPMRVLAPAGSGKTKTLVNRIVNLVNNGVETQDILALAFNKKAQQEMLDRLASTFSISNVNVSTFHAFGNGIVNQTLGWHFNAQKESFKTRKLLNQVLRDLNHPMTLKRNTDPLDDYMELLSKSKNELFSEKQMQVIIDDEKVNFLPIFDDYILITAQKQFYNYDDMVYLALRKLLSDPLLRKSMQEKYKYILVDEFQDLNKAQLLLLKILSFPENNVFVCGDDDQMIYSFRGAELDNILGFNQRDSFVKDQVLELNYRSSSNIVKQSKWLIDHNKNRVYKNIRPFKENNGTLELYVGESLKEQAEKIILWITDLKEEDQSYSDFAILYRYNEYRDLLYMMLLKHKIPVDQKGVTILNTSVGKTIMAYLTVLMDKENSKEEHYSEILKKPNKFLTNSFISTVTSWDQFIQTRRANSYLHQNSFENYTDFVSKVQNFKLENRNPRHIIQDIIQTFGFHDHFDEQEKKASQHNSASDLDILEIIVSFASVFDTIDDFYAFFLDSNSAMIKGNKKKNQNNAVKLSTVHKTKGNEYKNVAYYNLNASPTLQVNQKDYEEERRIAYVAITRAEKNLIVTTEKGELSPFIQEIFLNPDHRDKKVRDLKEMIHKLKNELKETETRNHDPEFRKLRQIKHDLLNLEKELKTKQTILKSMQKGK